MGNEPEQTTDTPDAAATNRLINDQAARQLGSISRPQLIDAGLGGKSIRTRIRSNQLTLWTDMLPPDDEDAPADPRSRRGERVYSVGARQSTLEARQWASILAAPGGAGYLDHVSACARLGLEDPRGNWIHVLRLGEHWRAPAGVLTHRTVWLPEADTTLARGMPCVAAPRAMLNAAVDVPVKRLEDMLDAAVRLEIYDAQEMTRVVSERPTARGVAQMVEAISRLDATAGTFRSIFERRTMALIEQSTFLETPAVNVLADGFRPDLHFIGTRAIIECDGRDYHRSPADVIADAEREEILRARGYSILRLRWADVVYDEERTLRRIEQFVLAHAEPPVPRG